MSEIRDLQKRIFKNKIEKGFNTTDISRELLLITEELGEAVRAYRREGGEKLIEEIVDVIIYCLGLLEMLGANASKEILKKVKANEKRVYKKTSSKHSWGMLEEKTEK